MQFLERRDAALEVLEQRRVARRGVFRYCTQERAQVGGARGAVPRTQEAEDVLLVVLHAHGCRAGAARAAGAKHHVAARHVAPAAEQEHRFNRDFHNGR